MRGSNNADKAHQARHAAGDHRQHLLEAVGDAHHIEYTDWCEQAHEMADKDYQDADVEKVRTPHQLTASQQLARSGAPRILLSIEPKEAPEQEHRDAKIGIPAEDNRVERLHHCCLPYWADGAGLIARVA